MNKNKMGKCKLSHYVAFDLDKGNQGSLYKDVWFLYDVDES